MLFLRAVETSEQQRLVPHEQVSYQGFHGTTEGVTPMLDAVWFQQPQHAINIDCSSNIDRIFGQFIHGGEIAYQPVSVGELEPIAPSTSDEPAFAT
jgi:hypothetical protein